MRRTTHWHRLGLASMIASLLTPVLLLAYAAAQTVSQGYGTTGDVQKGMIVMIDPDDSSKVRPLSSETDGSMQGVVVAANDTVVSLGGGSESEFEVYVAATGKYDALVSTQNGPIEVGDVIAISALDGIGMKADTKQRLILGKALTAFDGATNVNGTATLKTSGGQKKVSIGYVQIDISISRNPLAASVEGPPVPAFLQRSGEYLAGKPVSTIRLYVAAAILFITLFMTASLLYGGVRSSLISIGRNPLAKKSILKGLVQVVVLGLIVFVIGLLAIYLLLKL